MQPLFNVALAHQGIFVLMPLHFRYLVHLVPSQIWRQVHVQLVLLALNVAQLLSLQRLVYLENIVWEVLNCVLYAQLERIALNLM